MAKTVNDLCFGDIVYEPRVESLIEKQVVEVSKHKEGIKVGLGRYSGSDISDSSFNAAISTKISYKNYSGPFYVRQEDALAKQRELRIKDLKILQRKANEALSALNEFTLKYFTDL
jgi:hypothetical protein